jgi:hypothetical protein
MIRPERGWLVPFMSLAPREDAADVRAAIERVVASGWFILGPEVEAFEGEFARRSGARFAVGVGTGTDAIALALRALGIGAGDEVITAPLSAAYSALAIMMTGARPVFCDIEGERMTIDPARVESAITSRTCASWNASRPGTTWRWLKIVVRRILRRNRDGRSERSELPAPSAFIRRRISARWAMAERS